MESVGFYLHHARIAQGLTLDELHACTRISLGNLSALENDKVAHIGSAFFYKSYVRQVAAQLKLDYGVLEPAVLQAASVIPEPLIPGQLTEGQKAPSASMVDALRERSPRNLRWLYSLVSFTLMLVACSSFYGVWQQSRFTWRTQLSAVLNLLSPSSREAKSNAIQQSVASFPSTLEPAGPSDAGEATAFEIKLSALEPTWLSIVADGRQIFTGTLERAQTKILEGRQNAKIRTVNAGGLTFVFNGKPIGTLGPEGEARTVVFKRDSYEVLQPDDHAAVTQFSPTDE